MYIHNTRHYYINFKLEYQTLYLLQSISEENRKKTRIKT